MLLVTVKLSDSNLFFPALLTIKWHRLGFLKDWPARLCFRSDLYSTGIRKDLVQKILVVALQNQLFLGLQCPIMLRP